MLGKQWAVVAVAVAVAAPLAVVSDHQFPDNSWTRLGYCDTRRTSSMDYTMPTIQQMASAATRVKICTYGSTIDCVTSRQGTFPIQQLQAGRTMVSRQPNGSCCQRGPTCLRTIWTGPSERVNELMFTCSGGCAGQNESNHIARGGNWNYVYHGCGNSGGLHFTVYNGTSINATYQCSWGASTGSWSSGRGRLELFIDFQAPTTTAAPTQPTAAPTTAPTGSNDPANVARRVGVLEQQNRVLVSQVSALSSQLVATTSAQSSTLLSTLTSVAVTVDNQGVTQADLVANVTSQGTQLVAVTSALRAATSAAVGGGATSITPTVTATQANELVLNSGAAVKVTSGSCQNNDLCGAASFAATLRAALQNL